MKKVSLMPAIAAFVAVGAIAEQPTVYGKLNVTAVNTDESESANSAIKLNSNASRIGLKGSQAIEGSSIEAIYQAEFEVFADDGDKDGKTFTQRNIYVGLKGGFGTVKGGMFDTPVKEAQNKVDLFNDLEADIKNMISVNEIRAKNIIQYSSPELGPVVLNGAYIAFEDTENEDARDDGISASAVLNLTSDLYLAAAFDFGVVAADTDVARLVAQYKLGPIQLGALYEMVEPNEGDSVDAVMASIKYNLNAWDFKAQVGQADAAKDVSDTTQYSLGVDYKFSKNLKTFVYYTNNDYTSDDTDMEESGSYLGLGTELKF